MASFNKVILAGNLTRDPEYRVTPNGQQICKIGIAINRRFTTQNGEQRDETTYVDVDAWGKQAETISRYFSKGRAILIEGRLKLEQWQTQQGENRSRLGVTLESFTFIDGSGNQAGGHTHDSGNQSESNYSNQPAQGQPAPFSQKPAPPAQPTQSSSPNPPPPKEPVPTAQMSVEDEDEDVPF